MARVWPVRDSRMEHIGSAILWQLHGHGGHVRQRVRVYSGYEDVLHEFVDLSRDQRQARAETSAPQSC